MAHVDCIANAVRPALLMLQVPKPRRSSKRPAASIDVFSEGLSPLKVVSSCCWTDTCMVPQCASDEPLTPRLLLFGSAIAFGIAQRMLEPCPLAADEIVHLRARAEGPVSFCGGRRGRRRRCRRSRRRRQLRSSARLRGPSRRCAPAWRGSCGQPPGCSPPRRQAPVGIGTQGCLIVGHSTDHWAHLEPCDLLRSTHVQAL
jgi:hypothetical protein